MTRFKLLTLAAALCTAAAGGSVHAQERTSTQLTGADIAEIEMLWARFNQGLDFRDVELFLSAHTDDASFTTGAGVVHAGRAALRDYVVGQFERGVASNAAHINFSILIEPTPEGARGRGYWMLVDVVERPPQPAATGYFEDTYVKTSDGWRIKTRRTTRAWEPRVWNP